MGRIKLPELVQRALILLFLITLIIIYLYGRKKQLFGDNSSRLEEVSASNPWYRFSANDNNQYGTAQIINLQLSGSINVKIDERLQSILLSTRNDFSTVNTQDQQLQSSSADINLLTYQQSVNSNSSKQRDIQLNPSNDRTLTLKSPASPYQTISKPLLTKPHWISPQEGSDIISNPLDLIAQFNQSRVLVPSLQLERDFTVYFCKHHDNGIRFFFLTREGLLLHPRIHLVSDPKSADFIVYLPTSSPWHLTNCNRPEYRNKTILLDEGDGPGLFQIDDGLKWFLYFKRSFVSRQQGVFQGYMTYVNRGDIFPMTYTIGEAYIKLQYTPYDSRDIEVLCTLRGSNHDPVRLRVRQWVEEYIKARGIKNARSGEINSESRRTISKAYFENMYRSKIIVTSNPSGWEGDFRFCEALSSGALILIDYMMVPRPFPFKNHEHIVHYDNSNKTDIFEKLDYYRNRIALARKVAMQGYLHAMRYHRAVNLIDYVFRTAHTKLLNSGSPGQLRGPSSQYTQTGYDILRLAQDNAKLYKLHHR